MTNTERSPSTTQPPHPVVWLILYVPFGALAGFVGVALTFLATRQGLSITEGALLIASQILISWLKWLWAPIVDVTLSPKKWYLIATTLSAIGVFSMAVIPLKSDTLYLILAIVAVANFVNSFVGMAVEAMISQLTPEDKIGSVSAWFQAGNLGGTGLGGALGLYLLEHFADPGIAGVVMASVFLSCNLALLALPPLIAHASPRGIIASISEVTSSLWRMLKTRDGSLTAILCMLPVATGAAQGTLTQAAVAQHWGAGAGQVELVQGLFAGLITAAGCFAGGWVCNRLNARIAYSLFGIGLAVVAIAMAYSPPTVGMYIGWNAIYSFGAGLAYAAFTAMVLKALDRDSAATGYNVFASLSNFPLWWLGLLLSYVAEHSGAKNMLLTEAALGLLGVIVFMGVTRWRNKSGASKLGEL